MRAEKSATRGRISWTPAGRAGVRPQGAGMGIPFTLSYSLVDNQQLPGTLPTYRTVPWAEKAHETQTRYHRGFRGKAYVSWLCLTCSYIVKVPLSKVFF